MGEAPPDDGIVEPGMQVTVRFPDGEESTFVLGSREVAGVDHSVDIDVYSPQSPLGRAVNGKRVGEDAEYVAAERQQGQRGDPRGEAVPDLSLSLPIRQPTGDRDPVAAWRSRNVRVFARLPQTCMSHQARDWFFDVS